MVSKVLLSDRVRPDCEAAPWVIMEIKKLEAKLKWQPIETAPKDGTEIFIFRHGWDQAPVAQWVENHAEDGTFFGWGFDEWFTPGEEDGFLGWNEDIEAGSMPTHWMPLPEPPLLGKEK